MADLGAYIIPNKQREAAAACSSVSSTSIGYGYQDVFGAEASNGGMLPCFSSRVEDYNEIFTSCSNSSIPFLDLPLDDHHAQTDSDLWSLHCDYSQIFGGFTSLDYGVPYQDLFFHHKLKPTSSSQEDDLVWTPAETGSPSEESSEDPVSSENNQVSSNADSHYGYDDIKHFNVSYHKSNQISKEDGIRGTTHIAELNAVPAYTFIVEEDLPLHTTKCESSLHEEVDARGSNANNIDNRMVGEHFWETTPTQVSSGNDQRSQNCDGNDTCSEKPFVTVSDISLRTQPCEVPPPSRPPPKLTTKHVNLKSATSNLKYTPNYTCHGANDCSPPLYDVDVDSGSSAAASAAAMKEAMEIAQARLKSAKEMMERKKDSLQYREKVGLNDCKRDERRENGIAHDVRVKEDKAHIKLEKHGSDLNDFDRVGKGKGMKDSHVSLDSEPQRGLVNFSKQYAAHKHPKECKLTQGFQQQEVIGEWKAEEHGEKAVIAAENKSSKKKLIPTATPYKHGKNEMQAEEVDFVQQEISDGKLHEVKMACELEEDMKTLNVANVIGEREKHCQTKKAAQKICYLEEHEKSHNDSWVSKEYEKLNKICAQENYEKKLNETHKQGKKEGHEGEEYLKKQKEGIMSDENEKKMKEALQPEEVERREREACEREEFERKRENFERGESERRLEEHEKEEKEMGINESRQMESHQSEENEKRQKKGCEREESVKRSKESLEREQKEWNLKQAAEENKWRLKEIGEMEENEKRHKIIEMEEYEFFLTEFDGRKNNECKSKQFTEENEWELQSIHENEENERRETEECEREENVNRFEVSYGREEYERKLKQATEENERILNELQEREENMIHKDTHNHDESEKRQNDPCEDEVIEKILQKEMCELVDNEKKLRDSQELKDKRPEEFCTCESQNTELETANGQEQINNAFERDENNRYELSQDIHLSEENKNLKVDTLYIDVAEQKEELMAHGDVCMQDDIMNLEATHVGWEQEENVEQLKMDQDSCSEAASGGWDQEENIEQLKLDRESCMEATHGGWEQEETIEQLKTDGESCREESDNIMKIAQNASKHIEKVKNFKEDGVSYGLYKIKRLKPVNTFHGCSVECEGNGKAALKAKVDDSKKGLGNIENTVIEERDEKCLKEVPGVLSFKDTGISVKTSQRMGQSMEVDMEIEVIHPINEEENKTNTTDQERKENNVKRNVAREVSGKEGRIKDREQERELLKKLEEDRLREREKDRIAVEKVTREARERAFAETRERAERAAVERATAEVRQRAMLEARERLEKACAEARERSLAEKAYAESRLRAERAAVERATAEARERAVEKAMADRAAMETRVDRSISEKFSAVSRDRDLRHSASFSDVRNPHFQSSCSFSSSQRYNNTSNHNAFTDEKSQGTEVESAQRCKAKLERHQRTVERAAKALAEKNMRDQLAQREQAERNRLADTLDADVKRWSSGKEGNLRALLSTLQYILGPESGWQPIPLTDVITAVAAKKAYRKATLCVHPDKLQQRGASIQQKYVSEKVFDLLKDAWSKFNSEER